MHCGAQLLQTWQYSLQLSPQRIRRFTIWLPALVLAALVAVDAAAAQASHGYSYFGTLKYPSDMTHFAYANPQAPRGGRMRMGSIGTFNNTNGFAGKGITPLFVAFGGGLMWDSLLRKSEDELASYYGLLAESVAVADDLSWVEYALRTDARWHDGVPVTVDDVLWTFQTIKNDASVGWRSNYRDIVDCQQTGARSFRFIFREDAEKTPHLVIQTGQFAPQARHYWQGRDVGATTLDWPLGNGAYRLGAMDAGNRVVLQRVPDYWGEALAVNSGHNNFDRIEVTYFFDKSVMLQALRAGVLDFYRDQNEYDFATAYDFPGYHKGLFKKETYIMGFSYGMHWGLAFNTRRQPFNDIRVREALTLAYNFEWANRVYWHGGMDRNNSFFVRSGMQARGLPGLAELGILDEFGDRIADRARTHPIELPRNAAVGRNRESLLRADALLRDAGWIVRDHKRVNGKTGEAMGMEFLVGYVDHERMLTPYVDNLKRLGIEARLRRLESNLMTNRLRTYDFEATMRKVYTFPLPYPARMRTQFTSRYADVPNMQNYAGIQDPVVDALVERIATAHDEAQMNVLGQALDRVLHWGFYLIPDGHPVGRHLVYWDRFGHPRLGAAHMYWTGHPTLWWFDREASARVDAGLQSTVGD